MPLSRRADERIEFRETPCISDVKLSLKADEPRHDQRHEDVDTLFFPVKGLGILHRDRKGKVNTIVMEYFNSILFNKSGPVNRQHTNQSIKLEKESLFRVRPRLLRHGLRASNKHFPSIMT